jgi:hypothetical protein
VLLGELGWTSVQLKMMKKILIEWGRIATLPDGRPVKDVLTKQMEVELRKGVGTTVAVRVVTCARVFFGDGDESEDEMLSMLLDVKHDEWKEKVDERFAVLAQEEYERELKRTKTG